MLHEYAVEPDCMGDWQTFRYLIEQFGVSRGRLVSNFPKEWFKKAWEACESFKPEQRWKAEIELRRIKQQASIKSGRNYNGAMGWQKNALTQHTINPFRAIIVKHPLETGEHILAADDITHTTPCWAVARERKVPRTVDELGSAVARLLRISNRILFVDKMFNPYNTTEFPRWRETLERFILVATHGRETVPEFEYHCGIDNEEFGKPTAQRIEEFQNICIQQISTILPAGCSITIMRWDQHHGGDFFHDRYILTEKGGVRISWGLDRSKRAEETTDVTLLDDSLWQEYLKIFKLNSSVIRHIDSTIVHSSN